MKARAIIGKRVVRVEQERFATQGGRHAYELQRLVFEDGTVLGFSVYETPGDYAVAGWTVKHRRAGGST